MTSARRSLTYDIIGNDKSGSSTFGAVADAGEKSSSRIGAAYSKVSDAIGGEVGELLNKAKEGFDKIGESGSSAWGKLAIGGGVVAGLGVAMQSFASKSQQAEAQLKQSVENTGASFDDYESKISKAESAGAKFGDTNSEVATGLQNLVQATGDVDYSISILGVAYNLAAAKHESFNDATKQLGQIYNGSGGKVLKSLGIDAKVTAGNIDEAKAAIQQVSQVTDGQASASVDNFGGKVNEAKARITDWADKVAAFAAGPMAYLGTAVGIGSGIVDIWSARSTRAEIAQAKLAATTTAEGTAAAGSVAGNTAAATSEDALAASATRAGVASKGMVATLATGATVIGGTVIGVGALGIGLDALNNKLTQLATGGKGADESGDSIFTKVKNFFSNTGPSIDHFVGSSDKATASTDKLTQSLDENGTAVEGLSTQVTPTSQSLIGFADAFKAVLPPLMSVDDAISKLLGSTEDLNKSQDSFQLGLNNLSKSVEGNGRSLKGNTTGAIQNRQAVMDQIDAVNDLAKKQLDAGESTDTVTGKLNTNKQALFNAAVQAGLNAQQVQALINQYTLVPANVSTTITANTSQASQALTTYLGLLANAASMGLGSTFRSQVPGYAGGSISTTVHATGGIIGGQTIDEAGWEMLDLPNGTRVVPHGQSEQYQRDSSGGGGVVNHITIHMPTVVAPSAQDGRNVAAALEKWAGGGGSIKIAQSIK